MLNFDFLEKVLLIVSPLHIAYDFSRKIFLVLCSIGLRRPFFLNQKKKNIYIYIYIYITKTYGNTIFEFIFQIS